MTRVTFISADGERRQEVDGPAGSILLEVAQAAGHRRVLLLQRAQRRLGAGVRDATAF